MIEINLLPEELRKKEPVKISMPEIPVKKTFFMSFSFLLVFQLLLTLYTFYLYAQEASISKNIDALKAQSKELILKKSETTGMLNRIKEIRAFTSRKFYWSELLNAVSNSMTKGVWLRNLYVTDQGPQSSEPVKAGSESAASDKKTPAELYLVLEGSAVGQGQETAFIGKYLKQLKEMPYFGALFSEIKPHNINQKRLKDYDVYDFMIYCKFSKEKTS